MASESKPLILIVEDEPEMATLISDQLEHAGMHTQVFNNPDPVINFLKRNFVNLMLLDVNLPGKTGFDLLEEIRGQSMTVPVIFLTANAGEVDRVRGLQIGGDDYITKPFSYSELKARIQAVLRRAETAQDDKVTKNVAVTQEPFDFCGAMVNPLRLEIDFPDGEKEKIGRKELGILAFLANNAGQVLTRRSLIHAVWGIHADVRSRSLDQYIVKVRDHYQRHGLSLDAFRTIHGVGYTYDPGSAD